ncbi:MAG: nicotinate phosphoribosyltransferase [Euryarchaeota archaeon]|nr:nicotinate phosphoribosyltransferase [Euryarchaeota archaeon]
MSRFSLASEEEIRRGETTDLYFLHTEEVLRREGRNPRVTAEVALYKPGAWGILAGLREATSLLEGRPVDVWAMQEGDLFRGDEPVLRITGRYLDFARWETPLLGLLCQASGVATKAARIRLAAGDRHVLSFGTRRMHPALSPYIECAALIGGADGVSNVAGARALGVQAAGTMPHSLVLCLGDPPRAFRAFDQALSSSVPRICLVDTLWDEKTEALAALQALGKRLKGVRLDTPSSRRGNMARIVREVRWELDVHGGRHVEIWVSGGLDEEEVRLLRDHVDGFGVGTSIANAPSIDFALDIIEVEGKPRAKRGKLSGAKQVWREPRTLRGQVLRQGQPGPRGWKPQLTPLLRKGRPLRRLTLDEARARARRQLKIVEKHPEQFR